MFLENQDFGVFLIKTQRHRGAENFLFTNTEDTKERGNLCNLWLSLTLRLIFCSHG